jgi:DNA-binding transcriptional regulator YbjK
MYMTSQPPTPTVEEPPSAAPARRRRESNARRELLLRTTVRLIAENGIDSVGHRSVAEAAGVSLGSTTYWFSSRQEMLRQALEYFAQLEIEAVRARLEAVLDGGMSRARIVDELTDLMHPQLGDERWRTVAQYTFLLEAARRPELEQVCRRWTEAWEEALAEMFASMGARSPRLEARMFLGMLDGLLLGQLAAPDHDAENTVLRPAIKAWFERMPAGGS